MLHAEETIEKMLLTPSNSSSPDFWGKEIKRIGNKWVIENQTLEVAIPQEFDFFDLWCGKDKANAREYFQ